MEGYNNIISVRDSALQLVAPNDPLDLMAYVERRNPPVYPPWKKKLKNPDLEHTGPSEYLLSELSLLVIKEQRRGIVDGNFIYNRLEKTSILGLCGNLQDGYVILKKGIKVYLKLFGTNALFLWGSVVISDNDKERVPYLFPHNGNLLLYWRDLSDSFGQNAVALLLPEQK